METVKKCDLCGHIWNDTNRNFSFDDFEKCPKCGSINTQILTNDEEFSNEETKDDKLQESSMEDLLKSLEIAIKVGNWNEAIDLFEKANSEYKNNALLYFYKLFIKMRARNDAELVQKYVDSRSLLSDDDIYKYIEKLGNKLLLKRVFTIEAEIKNKINTINEEKYNKYVKDLYFLNDIESLNKMKNNFIALGNFKDSLKKIEVINSKIKSLKYAEKEELYSKALKIINNKSSTRSELLEARKIFISLGNFKSSEKKIDEIDEELNNLFLNKNIYSLLAVFIGCMCLLFIMFFNEQKKELNSIKSPAVSISGISLNQIDEIDENIMKLEKEIHGLQLKTEDELRKEIQDCKEIFEEAQDILCDVY